MKYPSTSPLYSPSSSKKVNDYNDNEEENDAGEEKSSSYVEEDDRGSEENITSIDIKPQPPPQIPLSIKPPLVPIFE